MRSSIALIIASILFFAAALAAQTIGASRWQGTTGNGRAVQLELKLAGSQLNGTFSVDGSVTPISDVTFAFKTTIDGQQVAVNGRSLSEGLELLPAGASNPVVLVHADGK
jgi:hypothetical protein